MSNIVKRSREFNVEIAHLLKGRVAKLWVCGKAKFFYDCQVAGM